VDDSTFKTLGLAVVAQEPAVRGGSEPHREDDVRMTP